jgi:glutathione synthase/RimK-type ligase-like ATP-grasp enzyme
MQGMIFLGIYREKIFSPGKVREDAAILDSTLTELSRAGYEISVVEAENLEPLSHRPAFVLTMAQSQRCLNILEGWQKEGTRMINSVPSIRNSYRKPLISLLAKAHLPIPSSQIIPVEKVERRTFWGASSSYWLKRGDVHSTREGDVAKVASREELFQALNHFRRQKIEEVFVQEHVSGEVIKFYGVGAGEYFRAFLASNGDDVTSQMGLLGQLAHRSAEAVGLEIYGGDAILTRKGEMVLVDLNDWPSFSRCGHSAAERIAKYVKSTYEGDLLGLSSHSWRGP